MRQHDKLQRFPMCDRQALCPGHPAIMVISSLTARSGPLPGQRPSGVAETKNCRCPWRWLSSPGGHPPAVSANWSSTRQVRTSSAGVSSRLRWVGRSGQARVRLLARQRNCRWCRPSQHVETSVVTLRSNRNHSEKLHPFDAVLGLVRSELT
jgi:hypothetical protein